MIFDVKIEYFFFLYSSNFDNIYAIKMCPSHPYIHN